MKKKFLISLLSVATMATVTIGAAAAATETPVTVGSAATAVTFPNWAEKGSGYNYDLNGETWTVGGTNKDYYRGYDVNGDLVVENADGVPYYKGGTQKKLYLDDLNMNFKIQTASGELAAGAHVGIGFGGELEEHYPTHGFVFEMQEDGFFDMYLVQAHYIYGGDGAWHQGEGDNVLGRLRDASGQEVSLDIGLNDEINLEIRYLSAAERSAMGLQHAGFGAYGLFVNDCVYYYLPTTDNKFYCVNGNTLTTDENGKYYGYLTVFGNSCGEVITGLPTPTEIAAMAEEGKTMGMRITFDNIYNEEQPTPVTLPAWDEKGSGGEYVLDGEKWTVGGTNMDYYRGYDVNGDLVVENADGVPYYKGGTQKKMYLDNFATTFKIQTASGELAAGAHVGIGFGGELEQHYPTHGFVFEMQEDGFFDMYLVQAHYIYGGDGVWHQAGGNNVLETLRDSNGKVRSLDIGLNDEIRIEIRYLSAAERSAMGLQHADFGAYGLFVNDYAYYYLPNTDNKFYCANGNTLTTDEKGYYGYLTVFGNSCGELISCLPTPAEITAMAGEGKTVGMRVTFDSLSSDVAKLENYSLSLNGDIALNTYWKVNPAFETGAMVDFTMDGKTTSVNLGDCTKGDDGLYKVSFGVNAKDIDKEVTAQVKSGDSRSRAVTCKVTDYIAQAKAEFADDTKLVALLDSLLEYGKAAAAHFDGVAYTPSAAVEGVTADNVAAFAPVVTGEDATCALEGASLMLLSKTSIRVYFTAETAPTCAYKVGEGEAVVLTPVAVDGGYYVEIPNIGAADLDTVYTITVGGCTVSYSALGYVSQALASKVVSLQNVAKALYLCNVAANAYFA